MKKKENAVSVTLQMLDCVLTTENYISYNSHLIGELLYTIRKDMELTKQEVVKNFPMISIVSLSRYENGLIPFSDVNQIKKIVHLYHILNL